MSSQAKILIQQVYATSSKQKEQAEAIGALMSALVGGLAGIYGNESIIKFCEETIAALKSPDFQETQGPLQ